MRLPLFTMFPLRGWPLLGLATLLLLTAALSLVLTGTGTAGAQDGGGSEPPAKPTGLAVATTAGSLDVALDWDDTEGAASYLVRWREYGPEHELNEGVSVETSNASITVSHYGDWVLRLEACNDAGCGQHLGRRFQVKPELPARPTGLTVATEAGSLDLSASWDAAQGADSYKLQWRRPDGNIGDNQVTTTGTSASFTVADYGQWVVRVEGCNYAGCGPGASETLEVEPASEPEPTPAPTVPAKPTGLAVATTAGSLDVALDWDDTEGAASYLVRWREYGPEHELNEGVSVETSNASITVSHYGDWVLRLEACNDAGCGQHLGRRFQVKPELPARPTGLTVATEAGSLDLSASWDAAQGADSYKLQWRRPDGNIGDNQVTTTGTSASFTVADYGQWVVRVEGCNYAGCGPGASETLEVEPAAEPEPTPEPSVPAKPTGLSVATTAGSLDVSLDWDDTDGAASYLVRWRQFGPEHELNDGVTVEASLATIAVAGYGDWVLRLEACNDAGCGPHLARSFETAPLPNRAPVVNEDADGYDIFTGAHSAPRGILVFKSFEGIFSDPDGDELTYTVSAPAGHAGLIEDLAFHNTQPRLGFQYDGDDDWRAADPALPDPITTEVTLTATDPGGLFVSLTGSFHADWESHPLLVGVDVHETSMIVVFGHDLQTTPAPQASQFTVNLFNADGASAGTIAVDSLEVRDRRVILTLASAPGSDQSLTLDYAPHADRPLKRAAAGGDSAPGFTGQAVNVVQVGTQTEPPRDASRADPEVSFSSAAYTVAEGGTVTVVVSLNAEPGQKATVPITHTPGNGASAADYSGVPASVEFSGSETEQSFTFSAALDTEDDGGETVELGFGTLPAGVTAGATSTATVSITQDLAVFITADPAAPWPGERATLTAAVANPPSEADPSYKWEMDLGWGWDTAGTGATLSYYTDAEESWTFRLTAAWDSGESATSEPLTVTWVVPNRAPLVNEDAAGYDGFTGSQSAPRGTTVHKSFAGIFSDPDGDELTYTVSVPEERAPWVETLEIQESSSQVAFQYDGDGAWGAVGPDPLPDPLTTAVTLTATDPEGLSASLTGYFHVDWASHPQLQTAEVWGRELHLSFDQPVRAQPAPKAVQFTVNVWNQDGSSDGSKGFTMRVSHSTIFLDLVSPLYAGQTLTLDYAHDDATPLKGARQGRDSAPSFTGQAVDLENALFVAAQMDTRGQVEIWSATLTVAQVSADIVGCAGGILAVPCDTPLTPHTFTLGTTDYQVTLLTVTSSNTGSTLRIVLNEPFSTDWTLHVGNVEFAVSDASLSVDGRRASWSSSGLSWSAEDSVSVKLTTMASIDYDSDDDGLIEIVNAAQLNAVRWDADGDGAVTDDTTTTGVDEAASYADAFPSPVAGMGCPDGPDTGSEPDPCKGYEIGAAPSTTALDIDLDVAPHNTGAGWVPIPSYSAVFEGNGNTVSGLFVNKAGNDAGLFHTIASGGKVRNLRLLDVDVTGVQRVGALAGTNSGEIVASYSTGAVGGSAPGTVTTRDIGGLIGRNTGKIHASYSSAPVTLTATGLSAAFGGGLVGYSEGGSIIASYATGSVSLSGNPAAPSTFGGLVGALVSNGSVIASFATGRMPSADNTGGLVGVAITGGTVTDSYYDSSATGQSDTGKGVGRTSSELTAPTGYTGIYANWNVDLDNADGDNNRATGGDNPWNFGTALQDPAIDYLQLTPEKQTRRNFVDYDTDDDGLIEITTAAQLNAVRWDPDGNGTAAPANQASYAAAFPNLVGCPASGCTGYEIGAAPSDPALDIDLGVAPYNSGMRQFGQGWLPIPSYSAVFEGNGNTVSGLFISGTEVGVGLFHTIAATGQVRNLGVVDANVGGRAHVGALAGTNHGEIVASYSTGQVKGTSTSEDIVTRIGGLVGFNKDGKIHASYSSASLTLSASGTINAAGGLVGTAEGGMVAASYATGPVSLVSGYSSASSFGGLVGQLLDHGSIVASYAAGSVPSSSSSGGLVGVVALDGTVTNSYYDSAATGQSDTGKGTPRTSAQLGAPTRYTGIYAGWNVDLDGDGNGDEPWNFGTASQYPVIDYLQLTPDGQPRSLPADYDSDGDGLIEITTAAQLNAVRWDTDGDGAVDAANRTGYAAAFPNPVTGLGCPAAGCTGYELAANVDLDTNGNGMADAGDDYWNGGTGWTPIPSYSATLEGNGHTISGLFINNTELSTGHFVGLFHTIAADGQVRNLGLLGVDVTALSGVGALAFENKGLVVSSYSTGAVRGVHSAPYNLGGLVGRNNGQIHASYSSASVTQDTTTFAGAAGGLVGSMPGAGATIIASYATGPVAVINTTSANTPTFSGGIGGLVGHANGGSIVASYATGRIIGADLSSDQFGGLVGAKGDSATVTNSYYDASTSGQSDTGRGEGRTSAELAAPTRYTGIYANWNVDLDNADGDNVLTTGGDAPWDFGTASQYPAIDYLRLTPHTQPRSLPTVTADAGEDHKAPAGATVTLEGSGSSTLSGPVFTYAWTQTSGTTVELSDADAQRPTFTAPDSAGDLAFSLTVSDGSTTAHDTVRVSIPRSSYREEGRHGYHLQITHLNDNLNEQGCASRRIALLDAYPLERGVAVIWENPGISSITHYRYQIQGRAVDFSKTGWAEVPGSDGGTTFFILDDSDLTSGQKYSILLQGVAGGTRYCFSHFVWFVPSNPDLDPPANFGAAPESGRSDRVTLTWDDPGGALRQYDIQYQSVPFGKSEWTTLGLVGSPNLASNPSKSGGRYTATVQNLECSALSRKSYSFRVREKASDDSIGPNSNAVWGVVAGRVGGPGDDVLTADRATGTNCIAGGAGNDTITGGMGNDLLDGGTGNDTINGNDGNDYLFGGTGNDALNGGPGPDLLMGDLGDDQLNGGLGNDHLHGGDGDDALSGGAGTNYLTGGHGNNTYIGGPGADEIDSSGGHGTVDYSVSPRSVPPVHGDYEWQEYDGVEVWTGSLISDSPTGGHAAGDELTGVENVIGSAFSDYIRGDRNANHFRGGAGNDVLQGGGGPDILDGGNGTDTVTYTSRYIDSDAGVTVNLTTGTGTGGHAEGDRLVSIEHLTGSGHGDTLIGDAGNNVIGGRAGDDELYGRDGQDRMWGDDGDDTLFGGSGGDHLRGGDGDDRLSGGPGADTLDGNAGFDRYFFKEGFGNDNLWGYHLGASRAASEPIYLCMGTQDNLPTWTSTNQPHSGHVITVTFDGQTAGAISLRDINTTDNDENLNVVIPASSGGNCADLLPPPLPPEPIWSATLTVQVTAGIIIHGCVDTLAVPCSAELTPHTFTLGDANYVVKEVSVRPNNNQLRFSLNRAIAREWTLYVGDRSFPLGNASLDLNNTRAIWGSANLGWSAGETVSLRLEARLDP